MTPVRQVQKKYCSRALIVAVCIGFTLILIGLKPQAKGLVLGCLFSIFNFILIGETLPLRMGRSRRGALAVSLVSIAFRFALMAAPLVFAIHTAAVDVFTVAPGLLMVQAVILADHLSAGLRRSPADPAKGNIFHG